MHECVTSCYFALPPYLNVCAVLLYAVSHLITLTPTRCLIPLKADRTGRAGVWSPVHDPDHAPHHRRAQREDQGLQQPAVLLPKNRTDLFWVAGQRQPIGGLGLLKRPLPYVRPSLLVFFFNRWSEVVRETFPEASCCDLVCRTLGLVEERKKRRRRRRSDQSDTPDVPQCLKYSDIRPTFPFAWSLHKQVWIEYRLRLKSLLAAVFFLHTNTKLLWVCLWSCVHLNSMSEREHCNSYMSHSLKRCIYLELKLTTCTWSSSPLFRFISNPKHRSPELEQSS